MTKPVVLEALGLDDPKTYELLARGDTLGVFQLDSGPIRSLVALDESRLTSKIFRLSLLYIVQVRWVLTLTLITRTTKTSVKRKFQFTQIWKSRLAAILGDTYGVDRLPGTSYGYRARSSRIYSWPS